MAEAHASATASGIAVVTEDLEDTIVEKVELEEDSDDDMEYEAVEVESEDEIDGADEEEEDLETALRLVREKATEDAKSRARAVEPAVQKRHEVIDDFIRNFFLKMGLSKSLETFQTEWYEKVQRGELRDEDVGIVPDIYIRNQELDNSVKALRAELDKAKEIAHKARSTWDKFRKERDFHRMHHRRVAQEKNSLVKDLRRLRTHLATYEPTLAGLEHKYQLAMKEKAISKLQSDRLMTRVDTLEAQLKQAQSARPPASAGAVSAPAAETMSTTGAKGGAGKGKSMGWQPGKDSQLPSEDRVNPFISIAYDPVPVDKFQIRKSYPAHIAPVSAMAMHPKKAIVATASDDSTWKMWSLPAGDIIMSGDGHKDWVAGIDFHPHGGHLATASGDGTVKLWDFAKSKCSHTFTEHAQAVWAVAFHDGGDFLASSSMDHTTKLWDLNSLRCRLTLRGHVDSVNHCVFQPFSNNICTCSGDKTLSLWDARSGLCIQTFYGHLNSINHCAFNLQGDTIASTDADGGVRLWDVRMVQERFELQVGPHPANKCAFDRSGTYVAVASDDGEVKIVNVQNGNLQASLTGHEESVQCLVFDRNGKYMVSAGSDNSFRLW
eukprot:CAMPEP_0114561352 /NCGR_PEP_ID=MMETSP0114-20121206/11957_1 /TAXON_ID=31324 /ORGANISM="Goniomonas sp, Strain m" /LENGTH=606 /DNA_ID=CAMNT_0001746979 /DNA_START=71 /DNA_END=1888 /DNA_ORIENTATION=-